MCHYFVFQNNNARHSRNAYHAGIISTNGRSATVIRKSLNAVQAGFESVKNPLFLFAEIGYWRNVGHGLQARRTIQYLAHRIDDDGAGGDIAVDPALDL